MRFKAKQIAAAMLAVLIISSGSTVLAAEAENSPVTTMDLSDEENAAEEVHQADLSGDGISESAEVLYSGTCGRTENDNAVWQIDADGVLTISGSGAMADYTAHEPPPWFKFRAEIRSIVIENGITRIGDHGFYNCSAAVSAVIPQSVAVIGSHAFAWCTGLENVSIPSGTAEIGSYAFRNCVELENIVIPEGVVSIGDGAFRACSGLNSAVIPSSVSHIGVGVFSGCSSLTEIAVAEGNAHYLSQNGILFNREQTKLLCYPAGKTDAFYCIPDGVTSFDDAFSGCNYLTDLTIPKGVDEICAGAFYRCTALKKVNIPSGVNSIGVGAFEACSSLDSVIIPEGVAVIEPWTFAGCSSLKSVTIPESVASIGADAFWRCSSLTKITIPSGVTEIEDWAFEECSGLVEISLPEGITDIGKGAFWGCVNLESITIPSSVTEIHDYAFIFCRSLKTVYLKGALPDIGSDPFSGLTLTVRYPDYWGSVPESNWGGAAQITWEVMEQAPKKIDQTTITGFENKTYTGGEVVQDLTIKDNDKILVEGTDYTAAYKNNLNVGMASVTITGKGDYTGSVTGTFEIMQKELDGAFVSGIQDTGCTTVAVEQKITVIDGSKTLKEGTDYTVSYENNARPGKAAVTIAGKGNYTGTVLMSFYIADHTYDNNVDGACNSCGVNRESVEIRSVMHMFRMYNPNTGEHFYTGSEEEKNNLIGHGWQYEGVGFTFPANTGAPVYRLFQPSTGEHLYTMDENEKSRLMAQGWNYEGIAFNSAYDTEAVQYRLHNPNATVGAYHFTFSQEERQNLLNLGWEDQGIGWYSCWK